MHDSDTTQLYLLDSKLVDDLYVEAMVLADEARAYLETGAVTQRDLMDPMMRLNFSCEALKITTRLMHVIAWLLSRRALARGEIDLAEARSEKYRLGDAAMSDPAITPAFPIEMRTLIAMSESLYHRAQRLEDRFTDLGASKPAAASPARDLLTLLESSF